jgi:hypothetical protein
VAKKTAPAVRHLVRRSGPRLSAGGADKWPRSPAVWLVSDVEPVGCLWH